MAQRLILRLEEPVEFADVLSAFARGAVCRKLVVELEGPSMHWVDSHSTFTECKRTYTAPLFFDDESSSSPSPYGSEGTEEGPFVCTEPVTNMDVQPEHTTTRLYIPEHASFQTLLVLQPKHTLHDLLRNCVLLLPTRLKTVTIQQRAFMAVRDASQGLLAQLVDDDIGKYLCSCVYQAMTKVIERTLLAAMCSHPTRLVTLSQDLINSLQTNHGGLCLPIGINCVADCGLIPTRHVSRAFAEIILKRIIRLRHTVGQDYLRSEVLLQYILGVLAALAFFWETLLWQKYGAKDAYKACMACISQQEYHQPMRDMDVDVSADYMRPGELVANHDAEPMAWPGVAEAEMYLDDQLNCKSGRNCMISRNRL